MHNPMRGRLRVVAAVLLCGALGTACMGGTSANSNGDSSLGARVDNAGPVQQGGVLHIAGTADALSLDPQKEALYTTHTAVGYVYSRLVAFKTGPGVAYGTNELESDLAQSWETPDKGKTWTFHLRHGVKWQPVAPVNGREFTSKDVMCTINRIQSLPGFAMGLISNVAKVSTPDDYTVTFNLKTPYAAFDQTMANPFLVILPCEATNGGFDPAKTAIGTGPFMLKSWKPNQERIYVRNPNYFEKGLPHLDEIDVAIMPDAQAQIAAFRSGKLDMLTALTTEKRQVDAMLKQIKGLQLIQEKGTTQTRVYMNAKHSPFTDLRVRRAVALAIDKKGMVNTIHAGGQLTGPITPTQFGALPESEVESLIPYDPAQAKKLLAEAGYPHGFSVKMVVTTGYGDTVVREAQWVQQDLAKVGIKTTLDVQDYATYAGDTWPNGKYDIAYGLQTPMLSADEYLSTEWTSTGSRNWSGVNDPKLDQMIAAERQMIDQSAREKALQDIERYIMENVSTPLPLYVSDSQTLLSSKVHNYYPHPDYSAREMQNVWLSKS